MKIKQVCEMTGLTPRAIRLYCERGLIHPKQEQIGGRIYTTFCRQDADTLRRISVLRRMEFTLDEISHMIHQGQLQEMLEVLKERLEAQCTKEQQLLEIIIQVQQEQWLSFEQLASTLEKAMRFKQSHL